MGRVLTLEQRKTVESIAKDKSEMIVFHTKAYYQLPMNITEDLADLSAKYARSIIDLVEGSKAVAQLHAPRGRKTEREMILVDHNEVPTTVGTIIDEFGESSKKLLRLLENGYSKRHE
jgi:hypothetical protein